MGSLIMMQRTVNLLAQVRPEELKEMGDNWASIREADDKYFKQLEVESKS
jgi:hypothetical protein